MACKELPNFIAFVRAYDPSHHFGRIGDEGRPLNSTMTSINAPTRIGHAAAMPGDVVLGRDGGVMFIPPQLAMRVVQESERTRLHDIFGHLRLKETEIHRRPDRPRLDAGNRSRLHPMDEGQYRQAAGQPRRDPGILDERAKRREEVISFCVTACATRSLTRWVGWGLTAASYRLVSTTQMVPVSGSAQDSVPVEPLWPKVRGPQAGAPTLGGRSKPRPAGLHAGRALVGDHQLLPSRASGCGRAGPGIRHRICAMSAAAAQRPAPGRAQVAPIFAVPVPAVPAFLAGFGHGRRGLAGHGHGHWRGRAGHSRCGACPAA